MTPLERDAELALLRTWLAEAGDGRGRAVFVSGEAGIGKSTVVTALVDEQDRDQTRVAVGRCDALATPRALGPFLDAAASLGLHPPADRDGLLGCLIEDIQAHAVTLLVVEDAHWADDATIELLAMLGRRVADLPLLLVTTYRDDEVSDGHALRVAIGDLVTGRSTSWLGLGPLTREGVRDLATSSSVPVDELYTRTGGNPFFVTEALASPGELVPTSVRLAVLARAARLDPSARRVLDAVAVVPGRAEVGLVQEMAQPSPGAIDACLQAGMLVAVEGTYTFRHELARLAIEGQLAEEHRIELHRRALVALTAMGQVDPARLAHHAASAGDGAALARFSRDACLVAVTRAAYSEAVLHGERALAAQQYLSADEVAQLKVRLSVPLIAVDRPQEAAQVVGEAVAHWRGAGDHQREAEALVVLSLALTAAGRPEDGMAPVERAVELLEQHPPGPELAAAYLRLTSAHMLARDRDTAVRWGERAIALAEDLGDPGLLGRALVETGIADVMDGRFEGLERVRAGIDIGRRHGQPTVVAVGLAQIGSGCGEMRRYDEAIPALVEGVAYTAAHHLEHSRKYDVAWLARCRFDLGQWDEAEADARDVLSGPRRAPFSRFVALNTLGWLRARRGDDDVWPPLDEALQIAREMRHLQRLWPVAVARAEAGALGPGLDEHVPLLDEVLELALRCWHAVAVGEIGLWLARAGRLATPPAGAFEPFALWIAGDSGAAAAAFREMGCPYEAAGALADAGDTASLREALVIFERLGAVPMATVVARTLRGRGVRVSSPGRPASHPSGLTDREQEVLKLVTAGFTNPQIAATLYVSRKTAEHHVSSILVKLGVTSRVEAAAAAVRLGLASGQGD